MAECNFHLNIRMMNEFQEMINMVNNDTTFVRTKLLHNITDSILVSQPTVIIRGIR